MGDGKEIKIELFGESINLLDPELGENFIAERGDELFSYIKKTVADAIKDIKAADCASMADGFREGIAELEEELKATDIAADIRNFLERVAAYFRSVVSRLTGGEFEADKSSKEKIKEKNMDSREYEIVNKLFDSGKITEEERDKLLDALKSETAGDPAEDPADAENIEKTHDTVDADDTDDADFDDDFDDEEYDVDVSDAKALVAALGKLGSKINSAIKESKLEEKIGEVFKDSRLDEKIDKVVRKSMQTADAALRQAEQSINKALGGLRDRGDTHFGSEDDDTVIKTNRVDYDVPYGELEIIIKYRKGAKAFDYSDRGKNVERIKAHARESLDRDAFSTVEKLLDEQFTGTYKKTSGDLVILFSTVRVTREEE